MLIRRDGAGVLVHSPAKVNLFLETLTRRPDGYHELATLMVAVSLYDSLEFRDDPSGAVRLTCDDPALPTGPENLVVRAADLLRQETGHRGGAAIALRKRVPMAAGLAGGSGDAAATLAGLNRLWRLGLDESELAALGARLGSDVPFFFTTPAAWCTGRGEKVEPLRLGRPLHLVLACPPEGLSTAEVFRNLSVPDVPHDGRELRRAAEAGDVEALGRLLFNRLQPVAERLCPAVAGLCGRLAGLGPAGFLMSGSGSTVFALCRSRGEALRVARAVEPVREGPGGARAYIVQSCS
jgi:4-diphosphocytidyl-2-C-methyl-D-erythritol kinase